MSTPVDRPFASTVDLDGVRTDREDTQDIAFDGDPIENHQHRKDAPMDLE